MTTKRIVIDDGSEDLLAACVRLKEKVEKKLKSKTLSTEDRDRYKKALRTSNRHIREAKRLV